MLKVVFKKVFVSELMTKLVNIREVDAFFWFVVKLIEVKSWKINKSKFEIKHKLKKN